MKTKKKILYISFDSDGFVYVRRKHDVKVYSSESIWGMKLLNLCISNAHRNNVIHEPYKHIVFWFD